MKADTTEEVVVVKADTTKEVDDGLRQIPLKVIILDGEGILDCKSYLSTNSLICWCKNF